MTRAAISKRRWLAGVALFVLLGGPTPGAVGRCSGDEKLDQVANPETYCEQRDQLICVRRELRQELSLAKTIECRRTAIANCQARSFAPGCRPTERQVRACISALRSLDTLHTPDDEIAECNVKALCTAPIEVDAGSTDAGQTL